MLTPESTSKLTVDLFLTSLLKSREGYVRRGRELYRQLESKSIQQG